MKKAAIIIGIAMTVISFWLWTKGETGGEETTTYYLVRHAEKAVEGIEDPDLSDKGQARAQRIAAMLKDKNVTRLYATPYKRTRQTLQPLAENLDLKILAYDYRDEKSITRMIEDCKGKTSVIAGHSNTIPQLANRLINKKVYTDMDDKDYTRMWEIILSGDKVIGHRVILY
jgi:phosphohistidine phosphatase SixA